MKRRRIFGNLLKAAVSAGLLAILISRVELDRIATLLGSSPTAVIFPLLAAISVIVPLLLALRWFVLLRGRFGRGAPSFPSTLGMTMAGLFFNAVLPTGAGGDVVKIYYATRGREEKLAVGSSVIVDRIVGSLSIMGMAALAICLSGVVRRDVAAAVGVLFMLVLILIALLTRRQWARAIFCAFSGIFTDGTKRRLVAVYNAFSGYFSRPAALLSAVGTSIVLQLSSIVCQYGVALALSGANAPAAGLFFAAIPLIWLSNLVPSIGGLGVREFTYVFFFSPTMGHEAAFALSLLVDLTIFIQAAAGAVVFLSLRAHSGAPRRK